MTPVTALWSIRATRLVRGLTQAQLAAKAGLRRATISDLETGKTKDISLTTLEALARALKLKPGDLLRSLRPARRGRSHH